MAISIVSQTSQSFGSLAGAVGRIQLDSSYPTGGYSLTPQMFGFAVMDSFQVTTTAGYDLIYNYSTQKLMAFTAAGGAGGTTGATSGGTPSATFDPLGSHNHGLSLITEAPLVVGTNAALSADSRGVVACASTAGGVTGALRQVPSTVAPATGEYSVNYAVGPAIISLNAADAITAISVSFLTGSTASTSAGTPSATFNALGTHTHTIGAGGGGLSEVSNGTNMSSVVGNYILMAN